MRSSAFFFQVVRSDNNIPVPCTVSVCVETDGLCTTSTAYHFSAINSSTVSLCWLLTLEIHVDIYTRNIYMRVRLQAKVRGR